MGVRRGWKQEQRAGNSGGGGGADGVRLYADDAEVCLGNETF